MRKNIVHVARFATISSYLCGQKKEMLHMQTVFITNAAKGKAEDHCSNHSSANMYLAHSENEKGVYQTMSEHSINVADFMRQFSLSDEFLQLYAYCGLIHDMGKYSDSFQHYLAAGGNKVQHSVYGALFAKDASLIELMIPVFGHHAGLPDRSHLRQSLEVAGNDDVFETICDRWKHDSGKSVETPSDEPFKSLPDILQKELFVRMLYSSLVDADSLDTERHFKRTAYESRQCPAFNANILLAKLQRKLAYFQQKGDASSINTLRESVRLYAEAKAHLPQGFFSLTLPTGLGKTICSINWALHHARQHANIKRIIIVLPFISIIDQTADVLKGIFNDDNHDYVLEHHSNVVYVADETDDELNSKQLATENWEYPIIITTAVQFFESLFSNKRSACRKLHNIQDSIVIFDEIQTLPIHVTEPTLTMLDNLQKLCRCSLLFCTATQPDFKTRAGFCGLASIEPLVKSPEKVFTETRRVTYHALNGYNEIGIDDLATKVVCNGESTLVVFNTKKKARLFYDNVSTAANCLALHLSTTMCPAHRKEVIATIRQALENKETLIVSSTQLIEAGVDIDFPAVYRELAPLESIIQSAGRCNREGKLVDDEGNMKMGDVYLFALSETGQPSKQYKSWTEFANLLYKGNEDKLYTHDFYEHYYRELVRNYANTDKDKITDDRRRLDFQTVAEKYHLIDNATTPLYIYNYNSDSLELYHQIKDKDYLTRTERQQLSQYCVQDYERFLRENRAFIGEERCGILVWHGTYSPDCGIPLTEEFKTLIL